MFYRALANSIPMEALLMAGGGGTRLWPVSTDEKPKQFQAFFDERNLLRTTYERIIPLISNEHIWLAANKKHSQLIKETIPELIEGQCIFEPTKRDNTPAIAVSQIAMQQKGITPDTVIVMLPCDHLIINETELRRLLSLGEKFLQQYPQYLLTIGITPTYPETGYGYIKYTDQALMEEVMRADCFVEKPDRARAQAYIESGQYVWNSGIYMWTLASMLQWLETFVPNTYQQLVHNFHDWHTIYENLEAVSLDYSISEKVPNLATIPSTNLGWSDIGDFKALGISTSGLVASLDSENCYIRNDTNLPLKVIGVKNLVIVNTPSGLLVCDRERCQDIKKLHSP